MTVNVSKPQINLREKLSELEKPSGVAGQDILKADTPQEVFNYINAGRRNLIINGAMQIAQRGTSQSVSNNSNEGYSTVDRYLANFVSNMGGTVTFEQATAPSGTEFSYATKFSCTATTTVSADHMFEFPQRIEAQDLQQLKYGTSSAQPLTLSFWVYTNKIGKYGVALRSYDGSNTDVNGQVYEVTTANTWQKITLTYTGNTAASIPNNNGIGMYVEFYLAAGTNRITLNSNTWSNYSSPRLPEAIVNFFDSTSNVFYITGIQLEVGSVATPFEHRSYGEELLLCQRYYAKSGITLVTSAPTRYINSIALPVDLRASPSIGLTVGGGSGGNIVARYDASGQISTRNFYQSSDHSTNSDSYVTFDAEL